MNLIRKRCKYDESFSEYLRPFLVDSVDFTRMPEDTFKQLLQQKDFVITEVFIEYLSDAVPPSVRQYSDPHSFKLFEIFIHHCAELPSTSFFLDSFKEFFLERNRIIESLFEDIKDQNKMLRIAQKLVLVGFTFSEHFIDMNIIRDNHTVLLFLFKHRSRSNFSYIYMEGWLKYALSNSKSECLEVLVEQGAVDDMGALVWKGLRGGGVSPACFTLLIKNYALRILKRANF